MHVSQNREQQKIGQKLTSHLQETLNNYSVSRRGVATLCPLTASSKIQCDSGESSMWCPGPHFPSGHRGRGRQRERESGGRGRERGFRWRDRETRREGEREGEVDSDKDRQRAQG